MKTLSEMQIAKEAILSEMEVSSVGGIRVGAGTDYSGPSNPSSVSTYVDGMSTGDDGTSGSMFGDSWSLSIVGTITSSGLLKITKSK